MYTQFFGLREEPFNMTPDPQFMYFSKKHMELISSLHYGVQWRKGFIEITGEVVSSSKIRAYLLAGDVKQANKLLGRPYRVRGEVVPGDGRGKTIGIPTANLSLWSKRAIPKAGGYACKAQVNGIDWRAVTNIGVRLTFENRLATQRVETHILDFDKDIYGETIYLDFHSYIRSEQRFKDVDALIRQIQRDITLSREILG